MTPQPRQPYVTLLLVALNILAAYVLALRPEVLETLGFDARHPSILGAVASLFLHQNLFHLLGNMVFLAAVGPSVESSSGVWRLLVVYFVGGLTGVFAHWLFARNDPNAAPLVGASACVAACIAYYNLRFFDLHVALAPKVGASILAITLVWVGLQVIGGLVRIGNAPSVAYWAHIGGFAVGLLLALVFRAPKQATHQLGHEMMTRMDERSPAARLTASQVHLADHPDDVQAMFHKAEALADMNDPEGEANILVVLAKKLPTQDRLPVLHRLATLNRLEGLASLDRVRYAEQLKDSDPDLAKRLLLSVIAAADDGQRPDALLAVVPFCEADEAKTWLDELAIAYPLHPVTDVAKARGLL